MYTEQTVQLLRQMAEGQDPRKIDLRGSEQVRLGAPERTHFEKQFAGVERFLAGLRFERRDKLASCLSTR